jgi:hypothetical protein
MKFSAIFLVALASLAMAADSKARPKSCAECKQLFDYCHKVSTEY